MEIRISRQRVPTRPIVFAIAVLSVVALALTGWYVLASSPSAVKHGTVTSNVAPLFNAGPVGPDAQDRDLQERISQIKEDTTHGH